MVFCPFLRNQPPYACRTEGQAAPHPEPALPVVGFSPSWTLHAALRAAPTQDGRAGTDTVCQQNGSSDSLQHNSTLILAQSFADVLVMKHPVLQ